VTVPIDIKPGGSPNSINLPNNCAVPVALLSSVDFNVVDVDVNTMEFAADRYA
jgi:hypothetical protein